MKYIIKAGKAIPVILFLAAYTGYTIIRLTSGEGALEGEAGILHFLIVACLGGMVLAIVWYVRSEDEVRQSIINKAYGAGFWATFVVLYLVTVFEGLGEAFQSLLPLWSVPLLGWLAGYLITTVAYR